MIEKKTRVMRSRWERLWVKCCGGITFLLLIFQIIKDGHP